MYYYEHEKKFLKLEEIKDVGLPIVDYMDEESYMASEMSWFTFTDMKKIVGIKLTDEERGKAVVGFEKVMNGRGYVPLYCFIKILANRKKEREKES